MIIRVTLPDTRVFEVEAENVSIGHLATQAAAQMGTHRDGTWTLRTEPAHWWQRGTVLDPALSAEAADLTDGQTLTLYQLVES